MASTLEQVAASVCANMHPGNRPAKMRDLEDLYEIVTRLRLMIAVLERRLDHLDGGAANAQGKIKP